VIARDWETSSLGFRTGESRDRSVSRFATLEPVVLADVLTFMPDARSRDRGFCGEAARTPPLRPAAHGSLTVVWTSLCRLTPTNIAISATNATPCSESVRVRALTLDATPRENGVY
jgi:hypothetical protein